MACFAATLVAAVLFRGALLPLLAYPLVVEASAGPADYAVLAGGDRCFDHLARLYREQLIRGIILIEGKPSALVRIEVLPSEEAMVRRELEKRGVPPQALHLIKGEATNSWEGARNLKSWITNRPISIVVVCPEFRSRELQMIYSQGIGDLADQFKWLPLTDRRYSTCNWWLRKEGVLDLFNSYLSLGYNWVYGEQASTWKAFDADEWLDEAMTGNE